MNKIFIGPWVGEFGIELLRWHGYARTIARGGSWSDVIVATHPDRFFLYEDFATDFVPYLPPTKHALANRCDGHRYNNIHRRYIDERNGDHWLSPLMDKPRWEVFKHRIADETTYINFASRAAAVNDTFDLLIHARATDKRSRHRKNWPVAHWNRLMELLGGRFSIASVGSSCGAHHIAGTEDLRGIPLSHLAGYCRRATLMVGPSSGPIHFGILSSAPVVTWIHQNEPYGRRWNPFGTPICCMLNWQPAPEVILSKIEHTLELMKGAPVEYVVAGTKRSGHHAIVDWIAKLDSGREIVHLNDCASLGISSMPEESFVIPGEFSVPKLFNEDRVNKATHCYNRGKAGAVKLLSYEEIPVERFATLPEISGAGRLVFVLRDSANFLASLKRGIPHFAELPFKHDDFRVILQIYKGYLREALGRTRHLESFRGGTVFLNYNRWHRDAKYRCEISAALGHGYRDADRHEVAPYGPRSSFDKGKGLDARTLDVLGRWKHFADRPNFWKLLDDEELRGLEREYYGEFLPSLSVPRRLEPEQAAPVTALQVSEAGPRP